MLVEVCRKTICLLTVSLVFFWHVSAAEETRAELDFEAQVALGEAFIVSGDQTQALDILEALSSSRNLTVVEEARLIGVKALAIAQQKRVFEADELLDESIALARNADAKKVIAQGLMNKSILQTIIDRVEPTPPNWFAQTRSENASNGLQLVSITTAPLEPRIAEMFAKAAIAAQDANDIALAAQAMTLQAELELSTDWSKAARTIDRGRNLIVRSERTDVAILEAALDLSDVAITSVSNAKDSQNTTAIASAAQELLMFSLDEARRMENGDIESHSLGLFGRLYSLDSRYEDAVRLTETAISMSEELPTRRKLFEWNGQLGALHERLGNTDAALAAYRRAAEEVRAIRPELARTNKLLSVRSSRSLVEPILLAYTELLFKKCDADTVGRASCERLRTSSEVVNEDLFREVQSVIEQLKTIEFERFFEEACLLEAQGQPTALEKAAPGTAVLYPIIFSDRIELLLSIKEKSDQNETPKYYRVSSYVQRDDFERTVHDALRGLARDDGSRGPLEELSKLYDWIIAPIEHRLNRDEIDVLVFAPDGFLRDLPPAALYDRNDGSFLVERVALASALGLSLIEPVTFEDVEKRVFVAGVTQELTVPGRTRFDEPRAFGALRSVESEITTIKNLFPANSVKFLVDDDFTPTAFENELQRQSFSLIHLATHAVFEGVAEESFLLASNESGNSKSHQPPNQEKRVGSRIDLDMLERIMSAARIRGATLELLTLSACETGIGNIDGESEASILGLAGVAFKSGARSVLASLWKIDDESTSKFMRHFYVFLIEGDAAGSGAPMGKARAVRAAQLELLKDEDSDHPFHWAPFVLYGNWL